jgi:hypothetical protein
MKFNWNPRTYAILKTPHLPPKMYVYISRLVYIHLIFWNLPSQYFNTVTHSLVSGILEATYYWGQ